MPPIHRFLRPESAPGAAIVLRVLLTVLAVTLCACSPVEQMARGSGALTIRGQKEGGSVLAGDFETGIYRYHDTNTVTVILLDGPAEAPAQAMVIRMLWKPRAAKTPISPTATNATIRHIIFTGPQAGEVGIYAGGGFMFPNSTTGKQKLTASIWDATTRLTDASPGFADRLGQVTMQGRFQVVRDDAGVDTALRHINALLRDRLGYPRLVIATPADPAPGATGLPGGRIPG